MKFKHDIEAEAGFKDKDGQLGSAGQILSSTGTQTDWIDQSAIASGSAEVVEVPVKNLQGSALTKGDPVYISGSVGASGILEVQLADAGNAAKMPAVGLLKQDLAINAEGFAVVTGKLRNLVTSPINGVTPNPNTVIYVKSGGTTGAALTTVKPTGPTNLIQNMGKVGRVSTSSDGTFIVSSILRSNDIPNLTTGKIWVGDGNTVESTVVHLDEVNNRMLINTTTATATLSPDVEIGGGASPTIILNAIPTAPFNYSGNYIYATRNNSTSPPLGGLLWDNNPGFDGVRLNARSTSNYAESALELSTGALGTSKIKILNSDVITIANSTLNVGIGTTSPSYKLDVNGGAQFNTNTGTTPFYITRLGSATEALSIKVTDQHVRFESIQDEAADSYGGFDFRMDGGVTEPNFVIRKNADDPILHVDGAGKVGVNSTNPSSTLQVGDGTADSSFRTYYSDSKYAEVRGYGVNFNRQYSYLRPTTDNYAFLYIGSQPNTWNELHLHSNKITFSDNTSEVMRINPGGNVGIGTTSPGQKLTIDQGVGNVNQGIPATSGSTQNGILRLQPGGPYGESFDFGMNVSTTYAWIQPTNKGNHSVNYNLSLNPNGGNVGIGTTNPDSKLEVASSGAEGILISKDTNNTSNSGRLFFETDTISEGFSFLNSNGLMTIRSQAQAGVTSGNARVAIDGSGNVNIGTTSASTVGGTAKMTIDVGASTSSPVSIVNGTTDGMYIRRYSTGGSYQLQTTVGSGNSGNLSLQSYGGNVGIGTTNPATKLHISDATTPEFRIEDTTNNRYLSLYQNDSNSYIQTSLNSPLVFSTHGSNERMRITTSGNIGIGTTSPSYKVSIAGSSSAQLEIINSLNSKSWRPNVNGNDFYITETGVGNPFVIQAGGNVGIGTTTPQAILDIQPSASNRKVTRIANDVTSTYFYNTQADAILAWTCGSYYQAEVVITANQTNGGDYNNLYIRGIWSNNHTSHNWDELERVGFLTGSTITMSVGQNGSTSNSGRLELDFDYISGSFSQLNIRVTDFYGSHSYTIT